MAACRRLKDEEIKNILAALSANRYALRDVALFVLGVRTGFRISELLSLTIGHVWQDGKVTDSLKIAKRHMKGEKERCAIRLHEEAKVALKLYVDSLGATDAKAPLFESQKGKAMSRKNAWEILKTAFKTCGLDGKLACHSMRKTFAERVYLASGKDMRKTQELMGHADLNSTGKYLSVNQEDLDDITLRS